MIQKEPVPRRRSCSRSFHAPQRQRVSPAGVGTAPLRFASSGGGVFADRFCWRGRVGVSNQRRCPGEVSLSARPLSTDFYGRKRERAGERVSSRVFARAGGRQGHGHGRGVKARDWNAIVVVSRDLKGFGGDSGGMGDYL